MPERNSLHCVAFSGSFHFALSRFLIAPIMAVLLCGAATVHAKELRIESFNSHVVVTRDGTIDVTEKIEAHFIGGPWHGLYRSIPIEYVTPQGLNYTLFLSVKNVTDGNGHRLKFDSSRVRHYRKLKIYIPDADDSLQTINIEYTIYRRHKIF